MKEIRFTESSYYPGWKQSTSVVPAEAIPLPAKPSGLEVVRVDLWTQGQGDNQTFWEQQRSPQNLPAGTIELTEEEYLRSLQRHEIPLPPEIAAWQNPEKYYSPHPESGFVSDVSETDSQLSIVNVYRHNPPKEIFVAGTGGVESQTKIFESGQEYVSKLVARGGDRRALSHEDKPKPNPLFDAVLKIGNPMFLGHREGRLRDAVRTTRRPSQNPSR